MPTMTPWWRGRPTIELHRPKQRKVNSATGIVSKSIREAAERQRSAQSLARLDARADCHRRFARARARLARGPLDWVAKAASAVPLPALANDTASRASGAQREACSSKLGVEIALAGGRAKS